MNFGASREKWEKRLSNSPISTLFCIFTFVSKRLSIEIQWEKRKSIIVRH